jgi:hypothetical protein
MAKKKAKQPKDSKAYKVISGVAVGFAAKAATKGLHTGWAAATGKEAPKSLTSPETSGKEAVAWTVLTTGGIAAAKLLAERAAVRYYQNSTGELPASLRPAPEKPAKGKSGKKAARKK